MGVKKSDVRQDLVTEGLMSREEHEPRFAIYFSTLKTLGTLSVMTKFLIIGAEAMFKTLLPNYKPH